MALNIGNEGPLADFESIDDILHKYGTMTTTA